MALWSKACKLPTENLQQIHAIYGDHFPIEIRHFLAHYIEEKFCPDIVSDNPQCEQYVANLINAFVQEIEVSASRFSGTESFLTKMKFAQAAQLFRQKYTTNPMQLFTFIRQCLATELRLVRTFSNDEDMSGLPALMVSNSGADVLYKIDLLRRRTQDTADDLRKMEQEQEAFALQYHECTKLNAHLQHMSSQQGNTQNMALQKFTRQKEVLEQTLNQKVAGLMQLRLAIGDKFKETIQLLNQLQSNILDDELIHWKREQQLSGNGANFNSNLDTIQEWCECLAELIWLNRQQIKEVDRLRQKLALDPPGVTDLLPQLLADVTQLLSSLVTSTFIIEKQPPQVMKTNTRFSATVRLLVGGKLNVHMTPPQVKVSIISEAQANILLKNDKLAKSDSSGEILNNTGTMEYQQATRHLSVCFRNMQLKKIKRAEKKGTESVMDEKFSLLFQSQFSVGGGELMFHVWTLSLPVVVIVHGNQEPHAWATVTWDNAFSDPGRIPFTVPEKVLWPNVADTLSLKFRAATKRALTDDNLRFLSEKAFRGTVGPMLSWAQFCKEPLNDRSFTFWEWFYAIMKLTREHLQGPWCDGLIMGFVRKKQAEDLLSSCACGTFLLRFSDSELGGITIAWVSDTGEVFSLQPFTSKDFAIRSLADRIADLNYLVYLYPDLPKDNQFGKYYTPFQDNQPSANNGYVKPLLVTHVPGWSGPNYANTPQHFLQSPDPLRDTPSVGSSYAGSVSATGAATNLSSTAASTAHLHGEQQSNPPRTGSVDYLDHLDDCPIDLNGLVNFSDFMQQGFNKQ